jgi:hypothetical protein
MVRPLRKTLFVLVAVGFGAGVYACYSPNPLVIEVGGSGEDSGAASPSGSSSGSSSGSTPGSGGGSSSGSSSGTGSASSPSASADAGESFSDLFATVLGPTGPYGCSSHHMAGATDSFLDLGDASAAYASLVGAPASGPACGGGATSDSRVIPGSPGASLLWLKVWTLADGGNEVPCGAQMPKNPDGSVTSANPLSHADQLKVKSWIAGGAPND